MTSRGFLSDRVLTAAPCLCSARDSGVVMTEDVREQLLEASSATKKAFNSYRREADPEEHFNSADGQPSAGDKNQDDGEMSFVIVIMQPILRFLQLLCENHNRDLQVRTARQAFSPRTLVPVECGAIIVKCRTENEMHVKKAVAATFCHPGCIFKYRSSSMRLHTSGVNINTSSK